MISTSLLDSLPAAGLVRAPAGFNAYQRPSPPNSELDGQVEAAGGRIVHVQLESKGIGAGRMTRRMQDASYYLLPA